MTSNIYDIRDMDGSLIQKVSLNENQIHCTDALMLDYLTLTLIEKMNDEYNVISH